MKPEIKEHFDRAEEFLRAADLLMAHELFSIALGRAYYAMFHAATAVLLERGIERRSHHALIGAFGQFVVKMGIMPKRFQSYLQDAFQGRVDGDYGSPPSLDAGRVALHIEHAREFIQACRSLCS